MTRRPKRGPLVADASRGRVRLERGVVPQDTPTKVALIAQYSAGPTQPRSISEYTRQLADNEFTPVIVSACESSGHLRFPHGLPESTIIIRRPNVGYDFGSWATALGMIPQIRRSEVVLLTNDSLVGPFSDIRPILDWATHPGPNIRALTSSFQFVRHMQSYFLAFRGGILDDDAWRYFFNSVRVQPDKSSVVLKYELGLSRFAFQEAYSVQEYISGPDIGVPDDNPTIAGWKELVEAGVPFVKRTMLTDPSTAEAAPEVRSFIKTTYHTDVEEW